MTFQPFCSSSEFSCRLVKAAWDALQTHGKSSWYNGKAQAYELTLPAAKLELYCLSQHFTAFTSQGGPLPALHVLRVYFWGALRLVVLHRIFDTIRSSLLLPTVMKHKTIYSSLELALRQLLRRIHKVILTANLNAIPSYFSKNFSFLPWTKYPTDLLWLLQIRQPPTPGTQFTMHYTSLLQQCLQLKSGHVSGGSRLCC